MSRFLLVSTLCLVALAGCGPEIGDDCTDSVDCSTDGSRFCDFTQPEGYCLIPECHADECPEEAVCVRFGVDVQARTFCMRGCEDQKDCRDGYECAYADPTADIPTAIIDDAPVEDQFCAEVVSVE